MDQEIKKSSAPLSDEELEGASGGNASCPVFDTCPACGTALRSEADDRYVYFVCPACGLKEMAGIVAGPE